MTGPFITFEGIDGCGKTTQLQKAAVWLKAQGYSVYLTREPGGTLIGEQIRTILLHPDNHALKPESELLLYLADRLQHLHQIILPVRQQGSIVLCDRFHDSTVAYQGYGRQLDLGGIEQLVAQWITPFQPDVTFLLQVPAETAARRIAERRGTLSNPDQEGRFDSETLGFFQRVAQGFEELKERSPRRFIAVDGSLPIERVHQAIITHLQTRLSPAHP